MKAPQTNQKIMMKICSRNHLCETKINSPHRLIYLTFIPPYSGRRTLSPTANVGAWIKADTSLIPDPTANTSPSFGSFVLSSGKYTSHAVCTSFAALWTSKRSPNGVSARPANG